MASIWKKIKDKSDSAPVGGPTAADWEAMNAKIEAHPDLNTSKKRGAIWWRAGLAVAALALMVLGFLLFSPQQAHESTATENIENPVQPIMKAPANAVKNESREEIQLKEVAGGVGENLLEENSPTQISQPEKAAKYEVNEKQSRQAFGEDSKPESPVTKEATTEGENNAVNDLDIPKAEGITKDELGTRDKTEDVNLISDNAAQAETSEEKFQEEKLTLAYRDLNPALGDIADANAAIADNSNEDLSLKATGSAEGEANLFRNGLRITALNVGAGYLTDFTTNFYGLGAGLDVDVQRKGLLLNTGLHFYQLNKANVLNITDSRLVVDTSYYSRTEITVQKNVDSTWIIDTAYRGHYAFDTTAITHYDTIVESQMDSTKITLKTREDQKVQLSYIELPILVGHRFRFNRFAVDVMGGVVLNQLTQANLEGSVVEKTFGMDAVLQPAVRFYFLPEWSVFGRAALRYGVVANEHRPQKFYSGFQLGLSYHW